MFTLESSADSIKVNLTDVVAAVNPIAIVTYTARFKKSDIPEKFTQCTVLDGAGYTDILSWINNDNIIRLEVSTIHVYNGDNGQHHVEIFVEQNNVNYSLCHLDIPKEGTLIVASDGTISQVT